MFTLRRFNFQDLIFSGQPTKLFDITISIVISFRIYTVSCSLGAYILKHFEHFEIFYLNFGRFLKVLYYVQNNSYRKLLWKFNIFHLPFVNLYLSKILILVLWQTLKSKRRRYCIYYLFMTISQSTTKQNKKLLKGMNLDFKKQLCHREYDSWGQ